MPKGDAAKPKIRRVRPYFFGIQCAPCFVCESPESTQTGDTPSAAYEAWAKDVPKTAIGRFIRRASNRVIDFIFGF